jgi:hypothetical protein
MDSDMKIFAPDSPAPPPGEELERLAAQTEALRESGNLDKAKRLGRELAGDSVRGCELLALAESFGFALTAQRERQLHVLMVFSAQQALRAALPRLLAEAAVTAMNNYLINHSKAFWDTISDGSAFTQYLLAVQARESARDGAIGGVFAHMCGQEDNTDLSRLGATVFTTAEELVKAKWEEAGA